MSEPIPESVPTSADPRTKRPLKKRALSPTSKQSANIEALFAHPEKEVKLPTGPVKKTLSAPPEIVTNVQGSSAGAGSGEFHVYKQSRRREYERVRMMEEEVETEQRDREWEEKKRAAEEEIAKKRSKHAKRRQKQKANRDAAKKGEFADGERTEYRLAEHSNGSADPKGGKPEEQIRNGSVNAVEDDNLEKDEDGIKFVDDD